MFFAPTDVRALPRPDQQSASCAPVATSDEEQAVSAVVDGPWRAAADISYVCSPYIKIEKRTH